MDSGSSNDDDEPKVCTVFSSAAPSSSSKTIFDTIAFSAPKKESQPETSVPSLLSADTLTVTPTSAMSKTNSMVSIFADDLQSGDHGPSQTQTGEKVQESSDSGFTAATTGDVEPSSSEQAWHESKDTSVGEQIPSTQPSLSTEQDISERLERSSITDSTQEDDGPLPTAKSLFADRPEVPFPVNIAPVPVPAPNIVPTPVPGTIFVTEEQIPEQPAFPVQAEPQPQHEAYHHIVPDPNPNPIYMTPPPPQHTFSSLAYTSADKNYDIWIPSEETQRVLASVQSAGSDVIRVPDKAHMTMPGIIFEEEMLDKVGINMAKLFGDAEASRRRILTADNVTQDDNGIRELIKLGCYRSAINLTKRLLILYGQGPGKLGQFSKHTPHSLQLWFTRISLLVRIREFAIADSELEAFKNFDSPDLFYEYYPPECFGCSKEGSLVPFHFRLLAAEIPQYMRRFSDTVDKLSDILFTVQRILKNVDAIAEPDERSRAVAIWKKREIRVLYSLANSSLFSKDYYNGFNFLNKLCQKDPEHLTQLKSAIGRLFLQHGDLTTAQHYFQEAAELRSVESESDQVDTLVDSALVSMSQNLFPEALVVLKQAAILQPDNFMITNNMSVCLLYMGKVKESLALMEATVRQNIPQSLQENVILNLSSMYELENSDGAKKLSLLKLISEYKGDGINLASLKMPNLV